MKTEQEIRERLEYAIITYLENQSFIDFFERVKPSKKKDSMSRLVGQRGYAYNLGDWESASEHHFQDEFRIRKECLLLADILGEPSLHAGWNPMDYVRQHQNNLSLILKENVESRKLGAKYHLYHNRLMIDIPASG